MRVLVAELSTARGWLGMPPKLRANCDFCGSLRRTAFLGRQSSFQFESTRMSSYQRRIKVGLERPSYVSAANPTHVQGELGRGVQ